MTTLWLDHLIFGSGHGMASPHSNQQFYWIGGELYWWSGWLGAQLASVQWRAPLPQERRKLAGYEFAPFSVSRSWGRCRVSWACTTMPKELSVATAYLREMRDALRDL